MLLLCLVIGRSRGGGCCLAGLRCLWREKLRVNSGRLHPAVPEDLAQLVDPTAASQMIDPMRVPQIVEQEGAYTGALDVSRKTPRHVAMVLALVVPEDIGRPREEDCVGRAFVERHPADHFGLCIHQRLSLIDRALLPGLPVETLTTEVVMLFNLNPCASILWTFCSRSLSGHYETPVSDDAGSALASTLG